MNQETYRNAPIAEAALDIRSRVPKEITAEALEMLRDEKYPALHQRPVKVEFKVAPAMNVANEPVSSRGEVSNIPLGFAYRSDDAKQVFQVRTDGFTHNRLAPYIDWVTFSQEARRLWGKYAEFARPEIIELLGLNYVNHIYVPRNVPFEQYLRTYINIPSDLPQLVNTYTLGFQISWPENEGVLAFVGQALGPIVKEGFATMVLSIQAFKPVMRPAEEMNEDEIWSTFETLRNVKNSVFEACITDAVRKEIR